MESGTFRQPRNTAGAVSEENLELVRRGIQSLEVFWGLLDEYVVFDLRGDPAGPDFDDVYVGREAVIQASRRWWGAWIDYRLDAEELIDAGSSVVVVLLERGRGKGSGAPFERRFAQVWTIGRGQIIHWAIFPDKETALQAAGVSE
jgi:ketosteroid isomerase-like protein